MSKHIDLCQRGTFGILLLKEAVTAGDVAESFFNSGLLEIYRARLIRDMKGAVIRCMDSYCAEVL